MATQRWRLDLAYDGEGLHGFADQPDHPTVVGLLRSTLRSQFQLDDFPYIVGAGRTDTGVHAWAQTVHVDLPTPLYRDDRGGESDRLVRSLNAQLAGRIRILRALPVSMDFHARFSAQWRAYRYLVIPDGGPGLSVTNAFAWSVKGPLDLATMNRAATALVGEHDFRAFCKRAEGSLPEDPLRREVLHAVWSTVPDTASLLPTGGDIVRFDIRATSFCHNMVRSLASALVAVGQGHVAPSEISHRLETPDRAGLPAPAPAAGLALVGVGYPEFAGGPSGLVTL
ncbi:MAG: tRNA pseudouridine(38-40) synthase TruA [Acidobacteria bacterium]|nr:tRNA pseudouridine(38-40) synthase TruA [Acidobacteriota bacterium]